MCGIVGVYNNPNAASIAAKAMYAEQHRGQESCGIASSDGKIIRIKKKMGLVNAAFTEKELDGLVGNIAIGHVRYPKQGFVNEYNSQPHTVETLTGSNYALASNGDIRNYKEVRSMLEGKGVYFLSNADSELLLKYIAYKVEIDNLDIVTAIRHLMKEVKGAFSTVFATSNELYLFRDPYGVRPMSLGQMRDGTIVCTSETCALDIVQAKYISWVKPAEIIILNETGMHRIENDLKEYRSHPYPQHCIFELVYFSRPDSYQFSEDVYRVREKIGMKLAEQDTDFMPDLIVPVPDSSNFIAFGYANQKKMPVTFGLIRNHYVGRTFIKPEQSNRDESVRMKFNFTPHTFEGKKVALIDDSIVRGTTIKKIIELVKEAGAKEVHLRIGSPPVKHSCFYGINTPDENDLIANKMSVQNIVEDFKLASLKYICHDNIFSCVSKPKHYCDACFSGTYNV